MSSAKSRIWDKHTKPVTFLYTNNEHMETNLKNNTIYNSSKEINLVNHVQALVAVNYTQYWWEKPKKGLNKWGDFDQVHRWEDSAA